MIVKIIIFINNVLLHLTAENAVTEAISFSRGCQTGEVGAQVDR